MLGGLGLRLGLAGYFVQLVTEGLGFVAGQGEVHAELADLALGGFVSGAQLGWGVVGGV